MLALSSLGVHVVTGVALLCNIVAIVWTIVQDVEEPAAVGLAVLYFLFGVPLSFTLWYYPVYTAAR